MSEQQSIPSAELLNLTAHIASAYLGDKNVHQSDLPAIISSIHGALTSLDKPQKVAPEKATPHLPIKKTITPDHLISLEDGGRYKSLKRHLSGRGLTPQQYREKWGLPHD